MIQFIYLTIGFVVAGFIVNFSSNSPNPDVLYVVVGIGFIVFAIWTGFIIADIKETIRCHLIDFHSLDTIKKEKTSYQAEMDAYVKEMKEDLVNKYREFEETIMDSIKDSKIIATILKDSGYAKVLTDYNSKIKSFLNNIHSCDRNLNEKIRDMKVRQDDTFYGYGKIIPKNAIYIELDD